MAETLYDSLGPMQKMDVLIREERQSPSPPPEVKRYLKDLIPELIEKHSTYSTMRGARQEEIISRLWELKGYGIITHSEFCKFSGFPE